MKAYKTKSGYKIKRIMARGCNVFLVTGGNAHLLIDTSCAKYRKIIDARLAKEGITKLAAVLLMHTHYDHADNAAYLKKKYNAKIIVHESEAEYLRCGNSPLSQGVSLPAKIFMKLFGAMIEALHIYEPCEPDIIVRDALSLADFGFNAYIMHTPGHTCGTMSLVIDDEIVLTGSAMFGMFPGTIMMPFADDINKVTESWGRLLQTKCDVFLPAHGYAIKRKLAEKSYNKRLSKCKLH